MSVFFCIDHWWFLWGEGELLCVFLVCLLESFGRVHFIDVDSYCCLGPDCSGGVLVILCFYLRYGGYPLLRCSSAHICPSSLMLCYGRGKWGSIDVIGGGAI